MILFFKYALLLALIAYVLRQARKPGKGFGQALLRAMNESHSALTNWGLSHVEIANQFSILDVGCGGGATIKKLAAIAAEGTVCGVDYADGSVAASSSYNADLIKAGRVAIEKASVSKLPFADDRFDLVTAIETQYYWPDPVADMREIFRVLKPGGSFLVIAETYKGGRYDIVKWPIMWLLRSSHLSVNDHRAVFTAAGYTHVEIFEERKKGWICGIGRKPA